MPDLATRSRPLLAVLMTVHDRRESTLRCLRSLAAQHGADEVEVRVVMVDDGCSDGTADAVAAEFPDVRIVEGSGELFWAGGMALAEQTAMPMLPDLLLWLNDDVELDPDALARLLDVHRLHPGAIVVGSVRDPDTGATTYGARRRIDRHPQRFEQLPATDSLREVDAFNGNIVLVPRGVRALVGGIDGRYAHAYADDDYSLRAAECGVVALAAAGTQGTCAANDRPPVSAPSPAGAWAALQHPTRRPLASQVRYLRRHAGWRWPLYLGAGYTKATFVALRADRTHR